MNKKILLIHRILFKFNTAILVASLIFYLIKWNKLPAEIGIHFDPNGNFDVVASKIYGFYPHLIGGIIITVIAIADYLIQKKSTGLKLSEKGEILFKSELILTLDCFTFLWSAYFSLWSLSVSLQLPLDTDGNIAKVVLILIFIGIGIQNYTCIKYKTEKKYVDTKLMHRLCGLISWLLTVGNIWVIAESWNRHPENEKLYFDPEYNGLAYFANLDTYLDKKLLLIPQIFIIILLIVFEIISIKANKTGKIVLVSLTDKLKLICGVFFFWWNLLLECEMSIGIVSVCLFTVLCLVSGVTYARRLKIECNTN